METQDYYNLRDYLSQQKFPYNFTKTEQERLKSKSKFFGINNHLLYKKDRRKKTRGKLLRVLQKHEIEPVLFMLHNHPMGGHLGVDIVFNKVREIYYWPQMYNNIKEYIRACDSCQRRGKKRSPEPLQPIPVGNPFYRVGIDIVGPLPLTANSNKYIIVATDYLTKWPEARAVSEATAQQVANFIHEDIICRHGCPQIILTDRGTHFRNQLVEKLLQKFEIKHLYSTPYHPATNGLVERFNRTLVESLAKTSENAEEWDKHIPSVLFAYRTAKQATTKIEPFYLVYGRTANFPTKEGIEYQEGNLLDRLYTLVNDLSEERGQAQIRIKRQQSKQKERHDRKITSVKTYEIGDKVLVYDAAKQSSHTGKLNPKWKGPYYIHDTPNKGVYKLRTLEGKVIQAPINGSLLKRYYERTTWVPQIIIT
jgi:ribosomal protein L21E